MPSVNIMKYFQADIPEAAVLQAPGNRKFDHGVNSGHNTPVHRLVYINW